MTDKVPLLNGSIGPLEWHPNGDMVDFHLYCFPETAQNKVLPEGI